MRPMKLLLLGGTREARLLTEHLAPRMDVTVILSLAGVVRRAPRFGVSTRIGGFGGVAGLADYLEHEAIDLVIDATHPFAAGISANAAAACGQTGVRLWRLMRGPWRERADEHWITARDADDAAARLPMLGERVFLSVGARSLAPFESVPCKHWLVRSIDAPEPPPAFTHWRLVTARGPFDHAAEVALLREHAIDVLVTKNSGGSAMRAKLDAARELGVTVLMIARPGVPATNAAFDTVEALLAALAERGRDHVGAG